MKLSRLQGVFITLFVFLVSFCSADFLIQSAADKTVSVLSINDESPGNVTVLQAQCALEYAAANEFIKKDFAMVNLLWYTDSHYCSVTTQSVIENENYFKNQKFYEQVFKPEMYQLRKSYPLRC